VLKPRPFDSLAPETVAWGRSLHKVERAASGKLSLVFKNLPAVETDLLVGCDGGWSRVRPMRSDLVPVYSGVTFVQTWISDVDRKHPDLARFVGPGSILALGDNMGLMAQRNANAHIRIYAALRVAENWTENCGFEFSDPAAVRVALLSRFQGWSDRLLDLLRDSDAIFQPWPLFTFPPEQSWRRQPDVTLLGDAAHMMPPFTGKGANYAILDALELANRLTSDGFADIPAALADYESAMLDRMSGAISETLAAQDLMIAADAPDGLAALIQKRTK
jgi:2-polyprenyl-6-methoxyphenol hydroxylase-like FAD-dependent oxidoreductase